MNNGVRIDLLDTGFRHIHLVLPHRLPGSEDLAVYIGQAHPVVVNEDQRPHAAAGQGFYRISTHAADAEHRHPGPEQPLHAVLAQEQLGP